MKRSGKTRDRILHHAIQEFVEFGFYGARMQRIADRAGVNKAMIFYYYSSKDQIYEEVLGNIFVTIFTKLDAISAEPLPLEKKIRQLIDVYAGVFSEYPDYLKLLQYELSSGGKTIRKFFAAAMRGGDSNPMIKLAVYFEGRIKAGEIRKVNPFHLLISIIGQVMAIYIIRPVLESVSSSLGVDMGKFTEERKDFIVKLVLEGIKKR